MQFCIERESTCYTKIFFLLVYFLSIDYSIIVHTRAAYLLSANDVARYNVVIAGSR